jgi:hypothetical protein
MIATGPCSLQSIRHVACKGLVLIMPTLAMQSLCGTPLQKSGKVLKGNVESPDNTPPSGRFGAGEPAKLPGSFYLRQLPFTGASATQFRFYSGVVMVVAFKTERKRRKRLLRVNNLKAKLESNQLVTKQPSPEKKIYKRKAPHFLKKAPASEACQEQRATIFFLL